VCRTVREVLDVQRRQSKVDALARFRLAQAEIQRAEGDIFGHRCREQLVVRVHYKKNWKLENKPASDRSRIGLYLARPTARPVRAVGIQTGKPTTTDAAVKAIAVRTSGVATDARVEVEAIRPDGSRVAVAGFAVRPGWNRRYWLARAIDLPKGSRLEATAAAERVEPIQLWLDVLP